jgi:uncharacterized membrane protein
MPRRRSWGPLIALASIAGFLSIRFLPVSSPWMTVLLVAQIAGIVWLATRRLLLAGAVATSALIALFELDLSAAKADLVITGLCHFSVYATLLAWFGPSLRPGTEPVITGFARQMRKTMPPAVVRYTRAVTLAWCAFFAAQLLISLGLAVSGDTSAWLTFVAVWNLPLVAIMALGEYGIRSCLFAREERTGLLATLAALRNVRISPGRPS